MKGIDTRFLSYFPGMTYSHFRCRIGTRRWCLWWARHPFAIGIRCGRSCLTLYVGHDRGRRATLGGLWRGRWISLP